MKQKDVALLVATALVAAMFAWVLSSIVFDPTASHVKVKTVEKISSSFPDVKNDSNYNVFLNDKALDLTQPIQIGNSNNNSPFNAPQ